MAPIFLMMPLPRHTQAAIACIAGLLSSGCATNIPSYAKALDALWTTGHAPAPPNQLNPAYRYLLITANDAAPAVLVLGYEDPHPQGLIEVWYSAKQEVIKTQNGRIISTAGLPTNWDRVQTPTAPANWPDIAPQGSNYQRLRDLSPGYQSNVADQVTIKPHAGLPDISLPPTLASTTAKKLKWFSESSLGRSAPLPVAWFAWGEHRGQPGIVYSRQCLTPQYCLQLQRWPQEPAQP